MTNPNLATLGGASAAMYATMAATGRIIDVLVAKGVLTRKEAAATLTAIAEEIRDDAGGSPAEEPAEAICKWLDDVAATYR
ncbi:hypothetical protein KXS15_09510 [Sinorhizobium meliloti]|uniref:hypothetical protein n=1 Tax=Rhizobium meliloti TaxID=382 RepID=UPI003F17BDC3